MLRRRSLRINVLKLLAYVTFCFIAICFAATTKLLPLHSQRGGELRVALCIAGQVARLEVNSKIENILQWNEKNGVHIDVFLSLDPLGVAYSKDEYHVQGANLHKGSVVLRAAELKLRRWLKGVAILNNTSSFRFISSHEGRQHYLDNWPLEERRDTIEKHVRQFWGHAECARIIDKYELEAKLTYDAILRLRDNSIVIAPIDFLRFDFKVASGVFVKACAAWGGVNDKVMLLTREYLHIALRGWLEHFVFRNTGRASDVTSPEKFLAEVLREGNVPVYTLSADELPVVDRRIMHSGPVCLVDDNKDCHPSSVGNLSSCERKSKAKTRSGTKLGTVGRVCERFQIKPKKCSLFVRMKHLIWGSHDLYVGFKTIDNVTLQDWGPTQTFYDALVSTLNVNLALELGVWKGQSCIFLASSMKKMNPDSVVVAVDTWLEH